MSFVHFTRLLSLPWHYLQKLWDLKVLKQKLSDLKVFTGANLVVRPASRNLPHSNIWDSPLTPTSQWKRPQNTYAGKSMQYIKQSQLLPTACDMTPQPLLEAYNPALTYSSAYDNHVFLVSQPKTFATYSLTHKSILLNAPSSTHYKAH